jgi:hypothetical protein
MIPGFEIVACALREGTLQPFLSAGINSAWLSSSTDLSRAALFRTEDLDAYQSILKHWEQHGKVPSVDIFRRSFPEVSYRLPDNGHTSAELVEIFQEDRRRLLTDTVTYDLVDLHGEEKHDEIVHLLDAFQAQLRSLKAAGDRPYRKVTLAELENLPHPDPLIDGVVDAGTVTMLSGPFSTGKSFIALDWALSIASGTSWLGHDVRKGRVLYVSAEGAHGQAKRVRAWKLDRGPGAKTDDNFSMIINPVQLGDPDHLAVLLEDARDYDVIVIDTVARCSVGLEENSARDMGQFIDALYKLRDAREECGTTVIVVHHTGHEKSRARGSSALPAGVDCAFITEADDPHTLVTLRSVKRKDGPPPAPVSMHLAEVGDSVVIEEVESEFAEAYKAGADHAKVRADKEQALLDWLSQNEWPTERAVAQTLGMPRSSLQRLVQDLVGQGRVVKGPGGKPQLPMAQ